MNNKLIRPLLLALLLPLLVTSCNDKFGDDLRGIGSRVEELEANSDRLKTFDKNIDILQTIVTIIQKNGYISSLKKNDDGSYTVIMTYIDEKGNKKDSDPIILCNGKSGKDSNQLIVGVDQYEDGLWYWTVNGKWVKDDNGNMVRAGFEDGIAPQLRIVTNSSNIRVWQISTDGGKTWTDLGVPADGADGEDDIFEYVYVSSDGLFLILKEKTSQKEIKIPVDKYTPF